MGNFAACFAVNCFLCWLFGFVLFLFGVELSNWYLSSLVISFSLSLAMQIDRLSKKIAEALTKEPTKEDLHPFFSIRSE